MFSKSEIRITYAGAENFFVVVNIARNSVFFCLAINELIKSNVWISVNHFFS